MPPKKSKTAAAAATSAAAKKSAASSAPAKVINKKTAKKKADEVVVAAAPPAPKAKATKKGAAAAAAAVEKKTAAAKKPAAAKGKAGAAAGAGATASQRVMDKNCPLSGAKVHKDYDCMLNQTNIEHNNNKFYVIQVLEDGGDFYTWNRWGRVGEPGQNKLSGPMGMGEAVKDFEKKFKDKTGNSWSSRNNFSAVGGKYTLIKLKHQVDTPIAAAAAGGGSASAAKGKRKKTEDDDDSAAPPPPSKLTPKMQDFVRYIFSEAKQSLTSSIDASITENGIETPLGVLSLEQVLVGEKILDEALKEFNGKKNAAKLRELSSKFFTAIPHRFGRTTPPVLNSLDMFDAKFQLIDLMKDMVKLTKKSANILHRDNPDQQLQSLGCEITIVDPKSSEFKQVCAEIVDSQKKSHGNVIVKVKNVFRVKREEEQKRFNNKVGNVQRLYHGSRIANWVGLLSRGILMPKVVVSQLGIARTDPGWLGNGIYFGNADTAAGYAGVGRNGTAFMLMLDVALGKIKDYSKITYGLQSPPAGFDSNHGVAGTEFYDDEYVIYNDNQQKIEYLVEFST